MTRATGATYNGWMLRIIVIFLFVTNLLLVGFQVSRPAKREEAVSGTDQLEESNIPTIRLFSELMEDQDLMSENRQCFTLGPFYSNEAMEQTREQLFEVSVSITERTTRALIEKGYWVFMPPYTSLLEANRVLFSLQALGLEDSGVVYEGEFKNSISLGYFLRQKNAQKRKTDLQARGYEPMMRVQRQSEPRYWLDYEQDPGSSLVSLDFRDRQNDFMQRSLPCPEQALLETTPADLRAEADETVPVQADISEGANEPEPEGG